MEGRERGNEDRESENKRGRKGERRKGGRWREKGREGGKLSQKLPNTK